MKSNIEKRLEGFEFRCPNCGRTFDSFKGLKIHLGMNNQLNDKDKKCPYCKEKFTQRSGVLRHIKRKHKDKLIYTCLICGNKFDNLRGLRTHISMKHKDKWKEIKRSDKSVRGISGKVLPKEIYENN